MGKTIITIDDDEKGLSVDIEVSRSGYSEVAGRALTMSEIISDGMVMGAQQMMSSTMKDVNAKTASAVIMPTKKIIT